MSGKSILRIQPFERDELNKKNARLLRKSSLTMEGIVRVAMPPADRTLPLTMDADLRDLRTLRFASQGRVNRVHADPDTKAAHHTEHVHTPKRVRDTYGDC